MPVFGVLRPCVVCLPQGVTEHMFVEPSTGVCYSAMRSPYLGIEALWNERNYWVNVQPLDVDSMHHLELVL